VARVPILGEALFSVWPDVDEVREVWERTMDYGQLLISHTLARLDRITARQQDAAQAVTHYSRDNDRLGDRRDWTRALSTGSSGHAQS